MARFCCVEIGMAFQGLWNFQNRHRTAIHNFLYRSGTVNSNTVNSKFHLIGSYCEIFVYNFPNIPCLKYTVNSNFHLIRSKTLLTNDFELTVPDLYKFTGNNKYVRLVNMATDSFIAVWVLVYRDKGSAQKGRGVQFYCYKITLEPKAQRPLSLPHSP